MDFFEALVQPATTTTTSGAGGSASDGVVTATTTTVLRPEYALDGTHLNPAYVKLMLPFF